MNPRKTEICKIHGETIFVARENETRWRCQECLKVSVKKRRRKTKEILVKEAGSKCVDCGYVGPPFMFDFDHREPDKKSFGLSHNGRTYALDTLRKEASKCDLVCANCHRMRTHKQRCSGCEYCEVF